jgi:hypothetical protein
MWEEHIVKSKLIQTWLLRNREVIWNSFWDSPLDIFSS